MKPKIRKLLHPMGNELETPILIPSYSSKGFALKKKKNKKNESEIVDVINSCSQFITEIVLFSAYDLYHNLIPDISKFPTPNIVMIDSGGYETSKNFDFGTVKKYSTEKKDWKLEYYESVLDQWPNEIPNIIVSFDHAYKWSSLQNQVSHATSLFKKYPNSINNFLIKPFKETSDNIDIKEVCNNTNLLKAFDIIGITEVELGYSIQDRMKKIMLLRKSLDDTGLNIPIHIFGSLDPVTSVLYFLAGADIFDGLTWLRYAYFRGMAVYPSNYGVLDNERGIHLTDTQVQTHQLFGNLATLYKLKYLMQKYINTDNFEVFDELGTDNFGNKLSGIMKSLTNK